MTLVPSQPDSSKSSFRIWNEDCIVGTRSRIPDESVDLGIHDPPFGIHESSFGTLYNRRSGNVIAGYVEAPPDYLEWTREWMSEARRVLKSDGSAYIVSGWSNFHLVCRAAEEVGFHVINHIIWKFNFGLYTSRKYISSHYPILYVAKSSRSKPTFNRECRFLDSDRNEAGRSRQYRDREDVWDIKREYHPGERKNANKLPEALIEKMVLYSSNVGDVVCDFFMGNFTTAHVAHRLGRTPTGFELNSEAFDYHMPRLVGAA